MIFIIIFLVLVLIYQLNILIPNFLRPDSIWVMLDVIGTLTLTSWALWYTFDSHKKAKPNLEIRVHSLDYATVDREKQDTNKPDEHWQFKNRLFIDLAIINKSTNTTSIIGIKLSQSGKMHNITDSLKVGSSYEVRIPPKIIKEGASEHTTYPEGSFRREFNNASLIPSYFSLTGHSLINGSIVFSRDVIKEGLAFIIIETTHGYYEKEILVKSLVIGTDNFGPYNPTQQRMIDLYFSQDEPIY